MTQGINGGMGVKVSILMITYNHEKYLAQALDSVLEQEVAFDYEIVVGEDNSSDGTGRILAEYQKRFPEKIRIVTSASNVGMHRNFIRTYRACVGEYVALLEGDDYWTSPHKLKMQVDFLDGHPDYVTCFHAVDIYSEMVDRVIDRVRAAEGDKAFTLDDIVSENVVPTCSAVFRNGIIAEFPEWLCGLKMLDWPVHILNAHAGPLMYLDQPMAMYRVHPNGVWNQSHEEAQLKAIIGALDLFMGHFSSNLGAKLRAAREKRRFQLLEYYAGRGKVEPALVLLHELQESGDPQIAPLLPGIEKKLARSQLYRLAHRWEQARFLMKKIRKRLRGAL
ncbi:glycosyltransferase [Geomonas edaphica]|uniref:glycosyltransferase n=1 Tax=Geomonas edaphica TaxID=2570226 RepID=UPI0010A9348D|nr:glycosyltransferase [Geomonas edaphica]